MSKTVTLYTSEECDAKYVPFANVNDLCVGLAIDGSNLLCDWVDPTDGTYFETSLTLPSGGGTFLANTVTDLKFNSGSITFTKYSDASTYDTYTCVCNYDKTTVSSSVVSTNYSNSGNTWTYKYALTSSGTIAGTMYTIRYYTSSSGGGVAASVSSSTFSETATTTRAISTAPSGQWGTMTVFVPVGSPWYLFTKYTTYVYIFTTVFKYTSTSTKNTMATGSSGGGK